MNTVPPFKQIAGTSDTLYALDGLGRVWELRLRLDDKKIIETWRRVSEEVE